MLIVNPNLKISTGPVYNLQSGRFIHRHLPIVPAEKYMSVTPQVGNRDMVTTLDNPPHLQQCVAEISCSLHVALYTVCSLHLYQFQAQQEA